MNATLSFLKTMTVRQFLQQINSSKVDIKANPNTGKLFATDEAGVVVAAVSSAKPLTEMTMPVVSYVQGDPTDRNPDGKFYLIHQKGEGGAETLLTLTAD